MKVLIATLLFILSNIFCFAQDKIDLEPYESPLLAQIDEEFVDFLFKIHEINKTLGPGKSISDAFANQTLKVAQQYKEANNPKFDFLISYYTQLSKRNKEILGDQFLSKPSLNNLFSIYITKELESNSFSGSQKIDPAELITFEVMHFPSEYSPLLSYYNILFYHVSKNDILKKSFDVNFKKLGLTDEEGTILFYATIFRLDKMNSAVRNQKCKSFRKIADTLPTFNGQTYHEFQPSRIDEIVNNIRHQNKSWDVLPAYKNWHKAVLDLHKRCSTK